MRDDDRMRIPGFANSVQGFARAQHQVAARFAAGNAKVRIVALPAGGLIRKLLVELVPTMPLEDAGVDLHQSRLEADLELELVGNVLGALLCSAQGACNDGIA